MWSSAMSLNVDRDSLAFTFKGGMLPMTVMELASADPEQIRDQLAGKLSQSPAFFQHTPVVLSVEKLDEPHLALERICAVCRAHKLLPVAVRGGADPSSSPPGRWGWAGFPLSRRAVPAPWRAWPRWKPRPRPRKRGPWPRLRVSAAAAGSSAARCAPASR